jgi:hypothetical protein
MSPILADDVPSDSEPATELLPLQLYPLELEIADTKDDIDSRLESVAAEPTSDRGCRNESGSSKGLTGALATLPSVGVASDSSTADPDQAWPKYSKRPLSDAFEGRREGRLCRIAFALSGGTDTLALDTLFPPVSGSLDRAFLPAADVPLAVVRFCHDRVLSVLTVRESGRSMLERPRGYVGESLLFLGTRTSATTVHDSIFLCAGNRLNLLQFGRKFKWEFANSTSLGATWAHGQTP